MDAYVRGIYGVFASKYRLHGLIHTWISSNTSYLRTNKPDAVRHGLISYFDGSVRRGLAAARSALSPLSPARDYRRVGTIAAEVSNRA